MVARRALHDAQHAAARFEKASSAHEAAKEMVTLAEEGFKEKGEAADSQFDQAWQEMLNHATNKVVQYYTVLFGRRTEYIKYNSN